jgi:FdhD protein
MGDMTEVHVHGPHATVRAPGLEDEVAVEEPLEIRVDGAPLAVTMRTPGNDDELALGFLFGEGLIDGPRQAEPTLDVNTVEVTGPLTRDVAARSFYTSSSCGVCGKGALEEVAVHSERAAPGPTFPRDLLADLPDRLRQPTFARTGGLRCTRTCCA